MRARWRLVSYGSLGLAVVAGIVCLVAVGGATGGLLAIVLMGGGLGGAALMLFLEVGLSEDREREAAQAAADALPVGGDGGPAGGGPRGGHRHPPRLRGMRRRPRRL